MNRTAFTSAQSDQDNRCMHTELLYIVMYRVFNYFKHHVYYVPLITLFTMFP